jgi:hypothetical protein
MNHNFANWEITEMLPRNNENLVAVWRCLEGTFYIHTLTNNEHYSNFKTYYKRDAWTWEDIRLYLESKDYYISISRNLNRTWDSTVFIGNISYTYDIYKTWNNDDMTYTYEFETYEEAREEAIKYCLNKINKDV